MIQYDLSRKLMPKKLRKDNQVKITRAHFLQALSLIFRIMKQIIIYGFNEQEEKNTNSFRCRSNIKLKYFTKI